MTARKGRTVDADAKAATKKPVVQRRRDRRTSASRKRQAEQAASKAKEVGAAGAYGPRERRAVRDAAIIARAHARTPYKEIASEFGVSVRTVEDVAKRFRATPSPLDQMPTEIVEELLRVMRASVAEFEAMGARQEERNPSVGLGARRAAQEARRDYVQLLSALGKLPDNLEAFRAESELARLGNLVLDALGRAAAGELAVADALELVRDLIDRPQLPASIDGTSVDA